MNEKAPKELRMLEEISKLTLLLINLEIFELTAVKKAVPKGLRMKNKFRKALKELRNQQTNAFANRVKSFGNKNYKKHLPRS